MCCNQYNYKMMNDGHTPSCLLQQRTEKVHTYMMMAGRKSFFFTQVRILPHWRTNWLA